MSLVLSVDLNVNLPYFHFISNDREAMRQLRVLVKRHRVILLLLDHVVTSSLATASSRSQSLSRC